MSKLNFTKIENALAAGLMKMEVDQLGKLADISKRVGRPELKKIAEKTAQAAAKTAIKRKAIIHVIEQALKQHKEPRFYEALGISQKDLKEMIQNSKDFKNEDWGKLAKIKTEIEAYKQKQIESHPEENDAGIIENQRKKHINKRFNVNEKWLPLN